MSGIVGLPSALGYHEEHLFRLLALNCGRIPSQWRYPTYIRPLNGEGEDGMERSVRLAHLNQRPGFRGAFGSGG